MKLISMTDFVLWKWESDMYLHEYTSVTYKYAKFLKQPLTLGMFVPCDEDGNVLEETDRRYLEAKDRVLFEGGIKENYLVINRLKNDEYLIIDNLGKDVFELTQSAIKQFML